MLKEYFDYVKHEISRFKEERSFKAACWCVLFTVVIPIFLILFLVLIWVYFFTSLLLEIISTALIVNFSKPHTQPWGLVFVATFILMGHVFHILIFSSDISDWTSFQRSGSLIVVLAILSFGSDYREKLSQNADYFIKSLAEFTQLLASKSGIRNSGKVIKKLEAANSKWKMLDLERIEKNGRKWEVALLAIGTLIWGYGDLVGKLFS